MDFLEQMAERSRERVAAGQAQLRSEAQVLELASEYAGTLAVCA